MNHVDKFLWFVFAIYAICCALFVWLAIALFGATTSIAIWLFISLLSPLLPVYVMVKILIDMFQGIRIWKICNLVLLGIAIYFYLWTLGIIRQNIAVKEALFVYGGIPLLLYTLINALINTIKDIKVWKILNIIFLGVLIYFYYQTLTLNQEQDMIVFKKPSSEVICFKNNKRIPCEDLKNDK